MLQCTSICAPVAKRREKVLRPVVPDPPPPARPAASRLATNRVGGSAHTSLGSSTLLRQAQQRSVGAVRSSMQPRTFTLRAWKATGDHVAAGNMPETFAAALLLFGITGVPKRVGKGASGTVWHAACGSQSLELAVKIPLHEGRACNTEAARELCFIRKGAHIHCIIALATAVVETGGLWIAGRLCIVMKYEESLAMDELKDIATREKVALSFINAVNALHSALLTHGDIKPDNLRVNPDTLQVVIIDFGRAAHMSDVIEGRRTYGTRGFRAPECVASAPSLVVAEVREPWTEDGKSDIWAAGVTTLCILSARSRLLVEESELHRLSSEAHAGHRSNMWARDKIGGYDAVAQLAQSVWWRSAGRMLQSTPSLRTLAVL
eukprot:520100-Rhodomonas_salina.2